MIAAPGQGIPEEGGRPFGRRERRPVDLRAYATRADGQVVELTLTDLSYDGCGVDQAGELVRGELVSLSVARRGTTPAVVRWVEGDRAGLVFVADAPAPVPAPAIVPRRHERVSIEAEVMMRRAGKGQFQVRVYDVSPDGCKAEFVDRPDLHELLWIRFPGMEALEASVRWIAGPNAGLAFVRPIHQAVFDLMVARLQA